MSSWSYEGHCGEQVTVASDDSDKILAFKGAIASIVVVCGCGDSCDNCRLRSGSLGRSLRFGSVRRGLPPQLCSSRDWPHPRLVSHLRPRFAATAVCRLWSSRQRDQLKSQLRNASTRGMVGGTAYAVSASDRISDMDSWQPGDPNCLLVAGMPGKRAGPRHALAHLPSPVADALRVLAGPDRGGEPRLPCCHLVALRARTLGARRGSPGGRAVHQASACAAAAPGAVHQRALEADGVLRAGVWDSRRDLTRLARPARDRLLRQQ